ncbi:NIN-like protein [Tanacetum coccineum]
MDSKRLSLSRKSANAYKLHGSPTGSGSGLLVNHWNSIFLEKQVPLCGDKRYLYPLWVSRKEETQKEFLQSDTFHHKTIGFQLGADSVDPHKHRKIQDQIRAALKQLTFREQHVIVQFWSPLVVGMHQLLTTMDQPCGFGVTEERLYMFRKDCEQNPYVVGNIYEDGDISPPARVFMQGLPEWTSDLTNYSPQQYPQQDLAISCNLHGYLALPVFDSAIGLCVGVVEVLGSKKYTSFAYEVQQIHEALKVSHKENTMATMVRHLTSSQEVKGSNLTSRTRTLPPRTQNLTCPQAFDYHATNSISQIPNDRRDNELNKILAILKRVCGSYNLPFAQTWAVTPCTSFVSHDKIRKECCSSFDTICIGKVCMSTAGLPFEVRDLLKWKFKDECRVRHLDKSKGFVGRALVSRGSCFWEDVTKLDEEAYPLVHYARIYMVTSCLAIFLHSVEANNDYVLEFHLPLGTKYGIFVQDVVETLKQIVHIDSGFVLGDTSPIDWSDSESTVTNVSDQGSSTNVSMRKRCVATFTDDEETSSPLKKLKIDFDHVPSVPVEVTFGQSTINFRLPVPLRLLDLEKEIAQRLNLEGKRPRLKYKDEVDDLILICDDADVSYAFTASGSCVFGVGTALGVGVVHCWSWRCWSWNWRWIA